MTVWKSTQVRTPHGVSFDVKEQHDHLMHFEFELKPNWKQGHTFQMQPTESFILFSVEGSTGGDVTKGVLEASELEVTRSARPELTIPLHLITVHDSVLEARLRRMESLIDGILSTDLDENSTDSIEARMAKRRVVLHRLGYKASNPLDHRRLTTPILFSGTERGGLWIRCGPNVTPGKVTITLRGLHKRPTW